MSLLERLLQERTQRLDALDKYYKDDSVENVISAATAPTSTPQDVQLEDNPVRPEQDNIADTVELHQQAQEKLDVTRDLKLKVKDQLAEIKRRTDAAIRRELRQRVAKQADLQQWVKSMTTVYINIDSSVSFFPIATTAVYSSSILDGTINISFLVALITCW